MLVALRLGLVVALPLDDPAFLFDLGNVEGSDVQAGLLLDVVLDFLIGSLGLCRSGVHLVQVKTELDMIVRVLLGQTDYTFDVAREDRKYVIYRAVRPT